MVAYPLFSLSFLSFFLFLHSLFFFTLCFIISLSLSLLYFMPPTYTMCLTHLVPPQEANTVEDSTFTITVLTCK